MPSNDDIYQLLLVTLTAIQHQHPWISDLLLHDPPSTLKPLQDLDSESLEPCMETLERVFLNEFHLPTANDDHVADHKRRRVAYPPMLQRPLIKTVWESLVQLRSTLDHGEKDDDRVLFLLSLTPPRGMEWMNGLGTPALDYDNKVSDLYALIRSFWSDVLTSTGTEELKPKLQLIFSSPSNVLLLLGIRPTKGSITDGSIWPPGYRECFVSFVQVHPKELEGRRKHLQRAKEKREMGRRIRAALTGKVVEEAGSKEDTIESEETEDKEVETTLLDPSQLLTVGARALTKHAPRSSSPTGWGGPASSHGTAWTKNMKAVKLLARVLRNSVWRNVHLLPHDIKVFEARNSEGYGVRFYINATGLEFRGFLEPPMEGGHEDGLKKAKEAKV
ncbi:hypothetical protein HDV05_008821 [Chytridiales sp. JEL 0842]|nr:hypothetical protein HDV05_008821 [Chytridiales sp. JEL 0842]